MVLKLPLEISIVYEPILQIRKLKSGDGMCVVGLGSDE